MLIILFLSVVLAVLGGCCYAYRIAFFSPKSNRERIPRVSGPQFEPYRAEISRIFHQLHDRPCEMVTIQFFDGLILSGRYYHIQDGAPLDIGFHGYRSTPFTDFAGGSELSFAMGHNLLLVDQRSHGKSQGNTISFGILERHDVLSWIDYALDRFGMNTQILLYGVSMGASTVLMASCLNLPENVKGIVADCPYNDPLEIILHVGKSNPLPNGLIRPFVLLSARLLGGFDLQETNAAQAVKQAAVPILIIHGQADTFVPCCMSEAPALANPSLVVRHTFPGAEHAISYLVDTQRYHKLVQEFVSDILSN